VRGVRYLVTRNEKTLTLRLVPESLGELRLEVTSSVGDTVNVRLISANPAVRAVLGGELPELRALLAREGIGVSQVSVSNGMTPGTGADGTPHRSVADFAASPAPRNAPPSAPESTWHEAPEARHGFAPHYGALNVFA